MLPFEEVKRKPEPLTESQVWGAAVPTPVEPRKATCKCGTLVVETVDGPLHYGPWLAGRCGYDWPLPVESQGVERAQPVEPTALDVCEALNKLKVFLETPAATPVEGPRCIHCGMTNKQIDGPCPERTSSIGPLPHVFKSAAQPVEETRFSYPTCPQCHVPYHFCAPVEMPREDEAAICQKCGVRYLVAHRCIYYPAPVERVTDDAPARVEPEPDWKRYEFIDRKDCRCPCHSEMLPAKHIIRCCQERPDAQPATEHTDDRPAETIPDDLKDAHSLIVMLLKNPVIADTDKLLVDCRKYIERTARAETRIEVLEAALRLARKDVEYKRDHSQTAQGRKNAARTIEALDAALDAPTGDTTKEKV